MDYDVYSGFMSLDESIFLVPGGAFPQPGLRAAPVRKPHLVAHPVLQLHHLQPGSLLPAGLERRLAGPDRLVDPDRHIDSLRIKMGTISQGWRFGGTNLGNTRGTYFDNFRVGFVRDGAAPALAQNLWDKYQDQFPFNENVAPGDNAAFDTTTALVRTGLNIVAPASLSASCPATRSWPRRPSPATASQAACAWTSCSASIRDRATIWSRATAPRRWSTRTRPTVLRRLPGEQRPLWDTGRARRDVEQGRLELARMDSAEVNLYPIVSRGIGGPTSPVWMGRLHELDPNFATLGIAHNVCFLIDPNGSTDQSNIDLRRHAARPYGAVVGHDEGGTKILPDGWFTPGTHVEYFLRKSLLESPGTVALLFDTSVVFRRIRREHGLRPGALVELRRAARHVEVGRATTARAWPASS
jgi:hypothetical protein